MRYDNLGNELERLRKEHRISLLEMATKANVAYVTLQRIIDGKTKNVQDATLRNIADAFDCEIQEKDNQIFFVKSEHDELKIAEEIASYGNRPDIQELLREIYSLPKAEQDEMWQIVDSIIKLRKSGRK